MQKPSITSAPGVTVAIPAYNEEENIGRIVDLFSRSEYPNVVEILVADGGSTDRTREIVEELGKKDSRVRLIDNPGKIQSVGLNEILKIAKGDLLLRADAHSLYAENYLEASVEALLESGALNAGGAQRFVAKTPFQAGVAIAVRTFLGSGGASYRDPDYTGYADTVYIGCYRISALRSLGGFSTVKANEDAEMNIRLSSLQPDAIYISSKVQTWYFPRSSWTSLFRQYFHYGRGRKLTQLKHPKANPLRSRIPFYTVSLLLLWLLTDLLLFRETGNISFYVLGLAALVAPISALSVTLGTAGLFREKIWKGEPGNEPGLLSRFLLTTLSLYTMPVAHFSGYFYQSIKYLLSGKKIY